MQHNGCVPFLVQYLTVVPIVRSITGGIPSSWGAIANLEKLTTVNLGYNQLTGPLDTLSSTSLVALAAVDLRHNQISQVSASLVRYGVRSAV